MDDIVFTFTTTSVIMIIPNELKYTNIIFDKSNSQINIKNNNKTDNLKLDSRMIKEIEKSKNFYVITDDKNSDEVLLLKQNNIYY